MRRNVIGLVMKPKSHAKARMPAARQASSRLGKRGRNATASVRTPAVGRTKVEQDPKEVEGRGENGEAQRRVRKVTHQADGAPDQSTPLGYDRLYHDAPVGYATLDGSGHIERINSAGAALLERKGEQVTGLPFGTFLASKGDRELFSLHLHKCLASSHLEGTITTELYLACHGTAEGRRVQLATRNCAGRTGRELLVVITDLSKSRNGVPEKLRPDQDLRDSESRFRTMAEQVPGFVYTTDSAGATDYVNQRFLEYTGLEAGVVMEQGWPAAVHPDDRSPALEAWEKSLREGTPFEFAFRLRAASGSFRWFRSTARPVFDHNGKIVNWFGSCTDIDDLMRVQAELGAANDRLEERVNERTAQLATANKELHREFMQRQRMEKEMTEISEQERRSLGQDLHDGICQHLTGVAMMADTLSDSCQRKSLDDVSRKVKGLADLIRTAANDARNVARGLQPVEMDANGLVSALQTLVERHRVPGKIQCRFECDRPVPVQDNEVAMHLYRIAQEAVVNAGKHSQARTITIRLSSEDDCIVLSIFDDGKGLPHSQELAPGPGLRMIRHRASVIGATVTIGASDRGGTMVKCVLPTPS